jgi:hypothetical protein
VTAITGRLVAPFENSLVFPGACSRLSLAVHGPRTTGTKTVSVDPQAQTIHPANPQRIFKTNH